MRQLTAKQKAFADALLSGKDASEAYRVAYSPKSTPATIGREAYTLVRVPHVAKYIDEQRSKYAKQEEATVGLTRARKREILRTIANDTKASRKDRMTAIQIDNLMTGDNKPVRIEGEITLNLIYGALRDSTGLPAASDLIELDPSDPQQVLPP